MKNNSLTRGIRETAKITKTLLITLLKIALFHGCFSRFLNCLNGTKSRKIFYKSVKIILGSVLMLWTQLASEVETDTDFIKYSLLPV